MKRPEQTQYPTPENTLNKSKAVIEEYIESNRFHVPSDKISDSVELRDWLEDWGWDIEFILSSLHESGVSQFKFTPR